MERNDMERDDMERDEMERDEMERDDMERDDMERNEMERNEMERNEEKTDLTVLLAQGRSVQFSAKGYSMYPFLNPDKGDQVIVEPIGERKLHRGNVVLYRRDGEKGTTDENGFANGILVLHRIFRCRGEELYLVGDNQNQIEGPLRMEQVIGIMAARVRRGKQMSVKNVLLCLSVWIWLIVCPIRPKIMRAAQIVKNLIIPKKK